MSRLFYARSGSRKTRAKSAVSRVARPASSGFVVIFASAIACRIAPPATSATASPAGMVRLWLTTGDQQILLRAQPDIVLARDNPVTGPVIEVDASQRYQHMIGFGAALISRLRFDQETMGFTIRFQPRRS